MLKARAAVEAPPLVGREAEIAELQRSVTRVIAGRGTFLAIAGDAGIGKTRLLHHGAGLARGRDLRVAQGSGVALSGVAPYATLVAALTPVVNALPEWRLRRLGDERRGLIELVILTSGDPSGGPVTATERWRCHRALRALLELLGDERPLLLALDDVHNADAATVEFLAYLLRRPPIDGVGIAVAYRTREVPAPARRVVEAAARAGSLSLLEPAPLTEHEAGLLLGPAVDGATRRRLWEESRGFPFYLEELARRHAGHEPLVWPVEEASTLDFTSRQLLDGGAILGEHFEIDIAAEVCGLDEPSALAAYDVLAERGLLLPGARVRTAVFRHPLVRRAVSDAIASDDRLALHCAAATALRWRGAPLAAVAYHVERSATVGDRDAVALLVAAGRLARHNAPADAATWLAAARRLLPDDTSDKERLKLLVALAEALVMSGGRDDARAPLREALALARGPLAILRTKVVTMLVGIEIRLGRPQEGRRLLLEELAELGADSGATASVLRLRLAMSHFITSEIDAAAREAASALLAAPSDQRALVAGAAGLLACVELYAGRIADARAHADTALAATATLNDAQMVETFDGLLALGHALNSLVRLDDAEGLVERGLAVARQAGAFAYVELFGCQLAETRRRQGQLDQAAKLVDEGFEAALVTENPFSRLEYRIIATDIELDRGRPDEALQPSAEAVQLALKMPNAPSAWAAHAGRAAALLETGHAQSARTALTEGCGESLVKIPAGFRPRWLAARARIELHLGQVAEARAWAERAATEAAVLDLPIQTAQVRRVEAELALAEGRDADAAALAAQAAELDTAAPAPAEQARDDLVAAEALVAAGRRAQAAEPLRRAHAVALEIGASGLRDNAERALGRIGLRTHPGVGAPPPGAFAELSERERLIARLVGDGCDNRAIAAELHLSDRTVERLVTTVRRKVGASSRAALASIAASRPSELR